MHNAPSDARAFHSRAGEGGVLGACALPRSGRLLSFLTNWKQNRVKSPLLAGDF